MELKNNRSSERDRDGRVEQWETRAKAEMSVRIIWKG